MSFAGSPFRTKLSDERSHIGWGHQRSDSRMIGASRKLRSNLLGDFGCSFDRVQTVIEQNEVDFRVRNGIRAREPDQYGMGWNPAL